VTKPFDEKFEPLHQKLELGIDLVLEGTALTALLEKSTGGAARALADSDV
jgi:hypothetical protein